VILTDAKGRPFEKPEPPLPDAPIEDKIAYLRAYAAWSDAVARCAGRAFARAFTKTRRKR
jgi:hypothetical protein